MRRLSIIPLVLLMACGAGPGGTTQKGDEPAPPPPPPAPPVCVPKSMDEPNTTTVSWTALKNTNVPVEGTIDGEAELKLNAGGLKGARLNFTFDPTSIKSGDETRDGRIANFFFQVGVFSTATYNATIDYMESEAKGFPQPGESQKIQMMGSLSISGQFMQVRTFARLENKEGEIRIVNEGTNQIDVKSTSLLVRNVNDLLQAAGVESMERNVALSGKLVLQRTCD